MRHFYSIFVVLAAALFVMFKLTDGQPIGSDQESAKDKFLVLDQTLTEAEVNMLDLMSIYQQFQDASAEEESEGGEEEAEGENA